MLMRIIFLCFLSGVMSLKCPICPMTQIWKECEQVCPPSCDSMYYLRKCKCEPGCGCPEGYIFESEGSSKCIPRSSCYSYCPDNMVYSAQSGYSCGTCENPQESCPDNPPVGCYCHPSYVLNNETGSCILADECPP